MAVAEICAEAVNALNKTAVHPYFGHNFCLLPSRRRLPQKVGRCNLKTGVTPLLILPHCWGQILCDFVSDRITNLTIPLSW